MPTGTNSPNMPTFLGEISVFQSDAGVWIADEAVRSKFGTLTWYAMDHEDPRHQAAISAYHAAGLQLGERGPSENIYGSTLRSWAATLASRYVGVVENTDPTAIGELAAFDAMHLVNMPGYEGITEAQRLGIHAPIEDAGLIEHMLAVATRSMLSSPKSVLQSLKAARDPSGGMFTAREQINALQLQYPILKVSEPKPSTTAQQRLTATWGAVNSSTGEHATRALDKCGINLTRNNDHVIYTFDDVEIARSEKPYTRKELRNALIVSLQHQVLPLAEQMETDLQNTLVLPPGHILRMDIKSDIRWIDANRSNTLHAYIQPEPEYKGPDQINAEFRVFTDKPRGHLFMTQGVPINFQDNSLLSENNEKFHYAKTLRDVVTSMIATFNSALPAQLLAPEQEAVFNAKISYEKWDEESRESGEPFEVGTHTENDDLDEQEMARLVRSLGLSNMTITRAGDGFNVIVASTAPEENREFFEQGIETYYTMSLDLIKGAVPTAESISGFADQYGLKYDEAALAPPSAPQMRFG